MKTIQSNECRKGLHEGICHEPKALFLLADYAYLRCKFTKGGSKDRANHVMSETIFGFMATKNTVYIRMPMPCACCPGVAHGLKVSRLRVRGHKAFSFLKVIPYVFRIPLISVIKPMSQP